MTADGQRRRCRTDRRFGAFSGSQLERCEPAGISVLKLKIDCDITVLPALGSSGVEAAGGVTAQVGVDGTIERLSNTIDWASASRFRDDFASWLADTHPEAHGQVRFVEGGVIPSDPHLVAPYYEEFIAQSDAYPVAG